MRARSIFISTFVLGLFSGLIACNDDKPKTQARPASSPEAIPTDLVFNAGFDDKAAATKITVVSDSGVATTTTAAGSTATLVNAGADPKLPLVYAFSTKPRMVTASLKVSQTGAGPAAEQTFKFSFTATPKAKFGVTGDATIDLKITKLELQLPSNAPPQAAAGKEQLEKALAGVTGHFDVTSHGDISDPAFDADKAAQGAQEMVSIMQQALELLVVPLPNEPVGVGAKWTKSESKKLADEGVSVSGTVTTTLMARDAQTLTLKVEATNSGTIPVNNPRAPKGTAMQRTTTASYTVVARLDGVAQKVDGESKNDVVQKVPGQPDQAMTVKFGQNIESK